MTLEGQKLKSVILIKTCYAILANKRVLVIFKN